MSDRFHDELVEFMTEIDGQDTYSDDYRDRMGLPPFTADEAVNLLFDIAAAEIEDDIAAGDVPATVRSFAELHDHVDANKYGHAFDWPSLVGDVDDPEYVQEHCDLWNALQDRCDRWLKAGRPETFE